MSRQYSDKALRSFFGAREGGQDRPQDVFTPKSILEAIENVWPEGIAMDAAAHPNAIVEANIHVYPDSGGQDGLNIHWPEMTYCNPPYRDLKLWIKKPIRFCEHVMLIPVRPLRIWWCEHVARSTQVAWLRPVTFIGHKNAFPAPLCMVYYGNRVPEFRFAFRKLATCINRFDT